MIKHTQQILYIPPPCFQMFGLELFLHKYYQHFHSCNCYLLRLFTNLRQHPPR